MKNGKLSDKVLTFTNNGYLAWLECKVINLFAGAIDNALKSHDMGGV